MYTRGGISWHLSNNDEDVEGVEENVKRVHRNNEFAQLEWLVRLRPDF